MRSFQFSQVLIVIAACKKKPLVSRVYPPGICRNRFVYLLPKIFFRGHGYIFACLYSVGAALLNRLWRHFKSLLSLTTTRIFKMGDNFILPQRHSFSLVTQWGGNAWWSLRPVGLDIFLVQHDKLSRKLAAQCTPIMGLLFWLRCVTNLIDR